MRNSTVAIVFTACYVLLYILCILFDAINIAMYLFAFSPFVVIWMSVSILKEYKGNSRSIYEV